MNAADDQGMCYSCMQPILFCRCGTPLYWDPVSESWVPE